MYTMINRLYQQFLLNNQNNTQPIKGRVLLDLTLNYYFAAFICAFGSAGGLDRKCEVPRSATLSIASSNSPAFTASRP